MQEYRYRSGHNKIIVVIISKKITIKVNGHYYYARYPVFMENISEDLIQAMLYVLFYGLEELKEPEGFLASKLNRESNERILISFSAGADSTALRDLLPSSKTHSIFLKRDYDDVYTSNQIDLATKVGIVIPNNMELIRKEYGKTHGFNVGMGYASLLIPLIDKLNAKHIVFGTVFEDVCFCYDNDLKYQISPIHFASSVIFPVLKKIGIHCSYPIAGLSEIYTNEISRNLPISNSISSCHVFLTHNACMRCYKCLRKQGMAGIPLDFDDPYVMVRMLKIFRKKPLKMAASTVYGIQKSGTDEPILQRYMNFDVSFLERVNEAATKKYCGEEMQAIIFAEYKRRKIEMQTEDDLKKIDKFVGLINDDKLYIFEEE